MKTIAIIPAAGLGKRMQAEKNKQFLKINNKLIIAYTLEAFQNNDSIDEIMIIVAEGDSEEMQKVAKLHHIDKLTQLVAGGRERQDSIKNALDEITVKEAKVLIHDGARPFIKQTIIDDIIAKLDTHDAVAVGVPVKDSLKEVKDHVIEQTIARQYVYGIQTPQAFKLTTIREAYEKAYTTNYYGTDDTELVEQIGKEITMVIGDYDNIKITTQEDLIIGEAIARKGRKKTMRVGTGYDVHQLIENRKLIVGGVDIPHDKGLLGHSDADVLLHAIMDALLGAAGLGDIGKHFPDTDNKYKGISSIKLLENVNELVKAEGFSVGNIDSTIVAQRPKMAPHIDKMRENIAKALKIEINQINIKATTTEYLGFEGTEEGISTQAIASINCN